MRVLIIAFIVIFATIDIIVITGPAINRCINKIRRKLLIKRRQKAFSKKIKELEIK